MEYIKKLKLNHYILFAIVILAGFSIYLSWTSPLSRAVRKGERINAIIIGTDWVDYARHSDTLMFISYDPRTRFLDVISIPRDTHFTPSGYHFRKINEIYAYHFKQKQNDRAACKELQAAVEELFQGRIAIPYYFRIDYAGFKKFIDYLGGVTIDIEEPMHYDDNWGKLHIHFDPGKQRLNGQRALEYVRYRGVAGDIGRIYRQQRFVKAVLARSKNPSLLFRLPQIVKAASQNVCTNFSLWDMMVGSLEMKDVSLKNVRLAQLPGKPKRDYWDIDYDNTNALLDRIFPSTGTVVSTGPRMRVEVWNASGKNGLAEKVCWILRKNGYDVTDWGTYSIRQKRTVITDLTDNLRSAQKISEIIGCGEVITRYDNKHFVDIRVMLGEDCIAGAGTETKFRK
ncbi:MAG: LCP family protein [Elusimicrobiota bacterium]